MRESVYQNRNHVHFDIKTCTEMSTVQEKTFGDKLWTKAVIFKRVPRQQRLCGHPVKSKQFFR